MTDKSPTEPVNDKQVRATRQSGIVVDLLRQARKLTPVLMMISSIVAIALGTILVARIQTGIPIGDFTRDPFAIVDMPFYTGALSNIGVMIWSGTAAICYYTWAITRRRLRSTQIPGFMLAAGILTTALLLDDKFMFHELVFPEYLNIAEEIAYATYVVATIALLGWYRSTILRTDYLLLLLAFAGFGLSIGIDLIESFYWFPGLYLFEDGSKFFGIVSWSAYFALASARFVERERERSDIGDELNNTEPSGDRTLARSDGVDI